MNICICGGGNLGHVTSGYIAAKKNFKVSVLTRHPERWGYSLDIALPDSIHLTGNLSVVTSKPADVIPQADIVIVCLPGMYIRQELEMIKPFLNARTAVGAIVSNTGFFFQAHEVIPQQTLFGFQRVPFISRITEYGHKASLLGFKKSLKLVIENSSDTERLRSTLETMFDTPVSLLDNYYEVSLSNSNPLLHTSRLYTMWEDYKPGVFYTRQSMFYEEWTTDAAQLYIDMDNEFQRLLKTLGVKEGSIPPVHEYYESHDAESLCHKIQSIAAFKGIKSPMLNTRQGWVPDFSSRYFTEDFGYGLRFIYNLTRKESLPAPHIKEVYAWGSKNL